MIELSDELAFEFLGFGAGGDPPSLLSSPLLSSPPGPRLSSEKTHKPVDKRRDPLKPPLQSPLGSPYNKPSLVPAPTLLLTEEWGMETPRRDGSTLRVEDVDLGPGQLRPDLPDAVLAQTVTDLDGLVDALAEDVGAEEAAGERVSGAVRVDDGRGGEGRDGVDLGRRGGGGSGGKGDDGGGRALGDDDDAGAGSELGGGGELDGDGGDVLSLKGRITIEEEGVSGVGRS